MDENCFPVVAGIAAVGHQVLQLLFNDDTVGDVDLSSEQFVGSTSR